MSGTVISYRYPPAARWLHWITVVLVVVMFTFGVWIVQFEPQDEALKLRLYAIHESTGVVLFVLVLVRLLRRLVNPPAPLPATVPGHIRLAARANHALLYAVLLMQPVIGFLDTNAWGFPLQWAGLIEIPSPIGKNEALAPILNGLHWFGAMALLLLIAAHLGGVFYHGVVRRDGVVQRML
jgi:cytochrome b561